MSRAQHASDRAAQFIIAQEEDDWDDARQAELDAWLAEFDGNKAAYWRLKHSWGEADRIAALGRRTPLVDDSSRYQGQRRWLSAAIAACLALVVGLGYAGWRAQDPPSSARMVTYDAPFGVRKSVGLSDGTRIQLNTASRMRASVTTRQREVWLEKGEAFFDVAHNEGVPFVVHTGDRQVTVLGTKFAVRRDGDKVTVTVLQGRVRLEEAKGSSPVRSTEIGAGDIAFAQGAATLVTARSAETVENALAWRVGMLRYDETALSEIAADFNRYNSRQMIVTDPEAASIRIGGMFPSSNPAAFARLLRDAYGLKVEETADTIKISN